MEKYKYFKYIEGEFVESDFDNIRPGDIFIAKDEDGNLARNENNETLMVSKGTFMNFAGCQDISKAEFHISSFYFEELVKSTVLSKFKAFIKWS